ncbi:ribonuclease T2-like [Emmonsiellopsis sp. PD_33]|nr:ribonuclease T2-like [Emmonsiellopsis sp. PD_33]
MPSLRSYAAIALVGAQLAAGANIFGPKECPADGEISCQGSSDDTCCFNEPGGLLLLTQFWDTDPVTGPTDSWTIHGLWPDNCDGTYESNCDPSREYSNISAIIEASGETELLDDLNTFWKDYKGDDESFWAHEWNKHGTCISTLEPDCYTDYAPQEEVVDYFRKSVELFKGLDSYNILANASIVPDSSKTYTFEEIQEALSSAHGQEVTINCDGDNLNELWIFFNVQGSVQTGKWIPAAPGGAGSSCPDSGIKYLPK